MQTTIKRGCVTAIFQEISEKWHLQHFGKFCKNTGVTLASGGYGGT